MKVTTGAMEKYMQDSPQKGGGFYVMATVLSFLIDISTSNEGV